MKFKSTIYIACAALALSSCEDYLDANPELGIDSQEVYSDYYSFRAAVDRGNSLIHNYVYSRFDWDCEIGTYSDEMQSTMINKPSTDINKGLWQDFSGREFGFKADEKNKDGYNREPAGEAVLAIRSMNNCLENFDKLIEFPTETEYTEDELRAQLLGQIYILRGWHYFELIRRYGGMPILDHVANSEENFDVERPTYLESSEWAVANMDSAIKYLPERWNNLNKGRLTKTTAKAVKEMILLYAASPSMNPDLNPYGSNTKLYNTEMCERAVAACVEAINAVNSSDNRYKLYDLEHYNDNFYSKESAFSDEALLQAPIALFNQWAAPMTMQGCGTGWYLPLYDGGWAVNCNPTQNAVDWFETTSGWDTKDARADDFDPENPYENRDPRFNMFIFHHGSTMYLNPKKPKTQTLEAQVGGYHYKQFDKKKLKWTGYAIGGKNRWPGANKFDRQAGYYRRFALMRVVQLYLDFAEAANEVYGPNGAVPGTDLTAVKAINIVRNRVGMPDVRSEYTGDKETFKKRIYNERAVELFQEFHRWHDIRRWRIAKDLFADAEHCIIAADIRVVDGKTIYGRKTLDGVVRVFEDKHYWYPFDRATINMMTVFKQNPGW